jgi:hypothetical protein
MQEYHTLLKEYDEHISGKDWYLGKQMELTARMGSLCDRIGKILRLNEETQNALFSEVQREYYQRRIGQ